MDEGCLSDCMEVKKFVPVAIVMQCFRHKCGVWHDLGTPIIEQVKRVERILEHTIEE